VIIDIDPVVVGGKPNTPDIVDLIYEVNSTTRAISTVTQLIRDNKISIFSGEVCKGEVATHM